MTWNLGVAVYYLMPLFQNYIVTTLLTLDNGPPVKVDLTRPRSAPITSAVRWSASGLKNQTHTVVVSLSPDEQDSWGQVDGFMYVLVRPALLNYYINHKTPVIRWRMGPPHPPKTLCYPYRDVSLAERVNVTFHPK